MLTYVIAMLGLLADAECNLMVLYIGLSVGCGCGAIVGATNEQQKR